MQARFAMPGEEAAVVGLCRAACAELLPHVTFDAGKATASFRRYLETADPTIFVAARGSDVAGVAVCSLHTYLFSSDIFVVLDTIYVRPDSRGTRAAACLIEQFLLWGDTVGAREWHAGVSTGYRMEATAKLCERMGAQRVGWSVKWVRA